MAWIYLTDSISSLESEESRTPSKTMCEQSPIAKSTVTVKESSYLDRRQAIYPLHLFGMTLLHSQQVILTSVPISSSEGFHVKISALQEMERAWQESEADYFMRSLDSVARLSLDSSFWKTFLPLLQGEEPKWLGKLPRWGMVVGGVLFPLRPLERYTVASDGSCWPTPTARDATRNKGGSPSDCRGHTPNLPTEILKMVATPTASQANKPISAPSPSRQKHEHGEDIQDSVGRLNPESIGKRLSVEFVECLMGYPFMWSALEDWAIQYVLSKSKKRSKS